MSAQMVHIDIRAAFRALLEAVPGLPAVAWEGRSFTPLVGTPFVRESLRPINSAVRALGRGGTISHTITAHLILFYPIGKGTVDIETMAGTLLEAFKPGTSLVYGTSKGVIMQAQRKPLLQEPNWQSLPIEISITAHTVN